MTTIVKQNILSNYTLSVNLFTVKTINKKVGLLENINKFQIKGKGKKENLSSNVDKILYGK